LDLCVEVVSPPPRFFLVSWFHLSFPFRKNPFLNPLSATVPSPIELRVSRGGANSCRYAPTFTQPLGLVTESALFIPPLPCYQRKLSLRVSYRGFSTETALSSAGPSETETTHSFFPASSHPLASIPQCRSFMFP